MHKSLLPLKSTLQGVSLCCSFLSVSGLALFAVEQLNSAGSFPLSKTVWWSRLTSVKMELCLHPLSSDKTSGPILHPLTPGLLCRQGTGPPTNAWIKSVLPK